MATITIDKSKSRNTDWLNPKQVGSLRQIQNIMDQPDGEWSMMGGRSGLQEDFGAFRFQMAYAGLALALAHYHRLPNAPGVFKPTFETLVHKMLLPDVWIYWHYVSQGGAPTNAHLWGKLQGQWDPVKKDNIMYSAYLLLLTRLYEYLFRDDRYTKPGALTMKINPFTFGERMEFEYDTDKISETIYWQMVENGYLGVACEPNCIFQICNQPNILSFRLEDFIKGTNRADEVTEGYLKAWEEFGLIDAGGHSTVHVAHDSRTPIPNALPWLWSDAWLAALMHSWNPEHVRQTYPGQLEKFKIPGADGTMAIKLWEPIELRGSPATVDTADFGWAAAAASELGDQETLDGLWEHADRYMGPEWRNGGLYYPRNDTRYDDEGILRQVEPITTNALLPYSRFNKPGGLREFYENPWTDAHFAEPMIDEVSNNIDLLAARYDSEDSRLEFVTEPRNDRTGDATLGLSNVLGSGRGKWTLRVGDETIATGDENSVKADGIISAKAEGDMLKLNIPQKMGGTFELRWS